MKNVLIIGATSTIAQDISKIYAQQGAKLLLVGRNEQILKIIQKDLLVRGAMQVDTIVFDLADVVKLDFLVSQIHFQMGSIDIAISCHGILGEQVLLEQNTSLFLKNMEINFTSHAILGLAFSTKMKDTGGGSLAIISSVAGDRGKKSNFIYGSAMSAKSLFTDGLRHRMHGTGVYVTTIKLGFVDTKMTTHFKKGPLWAKSPFVAQSIVDAIHNRKGAVYIPSIWRWIMLIVKSIPEFIFNRSNL